MRPFRRLSVRQRAAVLLLLTPLLVGMAVAMVVGSCLVELVTGIEEDLL